MGRTWAALTATPYNYQLNTTTLSNGTHTLTAVATDTSQNSATSAGVTITVNNSGPPPADTTPPVVTVTAPANGATVSGTIGVSATATDPDSPVASVQFVLDGANSGSPLTSSPYSISLDTTKLANGTHTLAAMALTR